MSCTTDWRDHPSPNTRTRIRQHYSEALQNQPLATVYSHLSPVYIFRTYIHLIPIKSKEFLSQSVVSLFFPLPRQKVLDLSGARKEFISIAPD